MKKSLCAAVATLLALVLAGCTTRAVPATLGNAPKENAKITDQMPNDTKALPGTEEDTTEPKATETARITAEEAKAAALTHAGVAATAAWDLEIDLEKERGVLYYEVSFESGGYEYEYLIDVSNGQIVHFEKEVDR